MDLLRAFCEINPGYQISIEKCWWPRIELGYGKNPKGEVLTKEALKWTIRSKAPKSVMQGYGECSTTKC